MVAAQRSSGLHGGSLSGPASRQANLAPDQAHCHWPYYPQMVEWREDSRVSPEIVLCAARLIKAGRRIYLVEKIPQQVIGLLLRYVRVLALGHHRGRGNELTLLQVS